tara:strand:- start:276 stop:647 length:372 start_codon:yes stop_codon:yes gene_type:complete
MKKFILILILLIPTNVFSFDKVTNFDLKKLIDTQRSGKTIVVHSWNKYCSTCAAQFKVFDQALKDFKNVEFMFYEQNKNKDIARSLGIQYWTTIVVYKGKDEIAREIGLTNKDQIYELIKKGI